MAINVVLVKSKMGMGKNKTLHEVNGNGIQTTQWLIQVLNKGTSQQYVLHLFSSMHGMGVTITQGEKGKSSYGMIALHNIIP